MIAVSQKRGDCRNHWPGCTCTLTPDQKLHCLSQNAFDKHSMTKRYMNIHAGLSVSRVECTNSGDWSAYTPVTCDKWNASQIILKKNLTKMLLLKSICPMWTHQWLKKKWETPKRNTAKCYIMCTFQDVKPTQETAGSGLNRLYNVLCLLWNIHSGAPLPRIYSITNTKHWITYTYCMALFHSQTRRQMIKYLNYQTRMRQKIRVKYIAFSKKTNSYN